MCCREGYREVRQESLKQEIHVQRSGGQRGRENSVLN